MLLQGIERAARRFVVGVLGQVVRNPFGLFDDVPRNETVGNLVCLGHRIVVDASFELYDQFVRCDVAQTGHVRQIDAAVPVERRRECLESRIDVLHIVRSERHGAREDIGEAFFTVLEAFEQKYFAARGILKDELRVLLAVQVADRPDEVVVQSSELAPQSPVLCFVAGLQPVKLVIGVPQRQIGLGAEALHRV